MWVVPSDSEMCQAALELYGLAMSVRAVSSDPALRGKRVDAMVTVCASRTPAVDLARGTASTVSCGSSCGLSVALSLTWSMFPARNSCWKTEGSTPSAARLNTKKTRLPTAMDGALPTSGYSAHRSGPAAPSLLTSSPTVTTIGSPCSSLRKFCAESGHPD